MVWCVSLLHFFIIIFIYYFLSVFLTAILCLWLSGYLIWCQSNCPTEDSDCDCNLMFSI